MSLRFPRRSGGVAPSAGEGGERAGADPLGEPPDPADRATTTGEGAALGQRSGGLSQSPVPPSPVVVPRWVQLVVLPLAVLGLWALARASGTVLLILLAASTIALILNPVVKLLSRVGLPRGLAILLVYLAGFALIGGVGVLLSDPVSTQISHLERTCRRS